MTGTRVRRLLAGLRRPRRGETGSAALELVIAAPVFLLVVLLVVGLGRMAYARQKVDTIANAAGRAASLERNTSLSAGAGKSEARRSLEEAGVSCGRLSVWVNTAAYRPGGSISVTVSCTANLRDVAFSGLPGTHTFTSSAVVPIETYRAS